MLGALRFLLAVAVAFSHMGLTPNFHFGSMAVMVFYLIAGYVMSHSFRVNFDGRLENVPGFYLDRFFRLYPLYIVSLVLILAFVAVTGYGKLYFDLKSTWVNLTMFQLNSHSTIMNPATWSLGTEVQFYLLLPFLVRFRALKYALLPASYAIFVAATLGSIDTLAWGYKLLPGTLWFFILGSIIYDSIHDTTNRSRNIVLAVFAIGTVHLAVMSFFPAPIAQPYNFEELSGLLFGIVALYMLGTSNPAHRGLDNWLGKLSYPLFLSHAVVLYAFDHMRAAHGFDPGLRGFVALQLLASVAVSVPLVFLDDYFQHIRKQLQGRRQAPSPALAQAA
jgi:peptidoglycan/LPS O-acetylase OafA/YrhL